MHNGWTALRKWDWMFSYKIFSCKIDIIVMFLLVIGPLCGTEYVMYSLSGLLMSWNRNKRWPIFFSFRTVSLLKTVLTVESVQLWHGFLCFLGCSSASWAIFELLVCCCFIVCVTVEEIPIHCGHNNLFHPVLSCLVLFNCIQSAFSTV